MEHELMLTVREAASLLRIGRNLAYELVARGDIPSRRLGRRILIPRPELERRFGLSATRSSIEISEYLRNGGCPKEPATWKNESP